ncbi:precorrin-6y C5,15-methyltransferase (decarboxylating) subunit CbiE [Clostridium senegalense]|uniref:precorrin-6y C5,15-methyltransferase (decarboxylating) subunit CbiE n=1 Tax=Clostridium senegalense TaxID=1465809 RepID=UPI000287E396|nr:precorrin-6y C5,15-methyltransferase (decarboxylating) subunit CbiE [Clostridium senegalense]
MVYIVGLGPGNKDYILPIATQTMEKCDVILGFSRAIESINHIKKEKMPLNSLNSILEYIDKNKEKEISIIASGDPCFYGITNYIKKNFNGEILVIPGISSFQYFMSKLCKCWNGVHLGSLHGREEEFLTTIEEKGSGIFLTDKNNSPKKLCKLLYENNFKSKVYIGENLSYEDEQIFQGEPKEFINVEFNGISIIYIEKI